MKPIVLSDESVNVYGFRVLTKGIDLSQFNNNPVMLYNHRRAGRWDDAVDQRLPIGKWTDVKKEESKLVGMPEFDADDEFATKVGNKYEKGYLNAASIGFDIIEISEDPKYMVPGQTRPTIIKCRLKEASIADIPANANCTKLTYQGKSLALDGNGDDAKIEAILPTINQQPKNKSDMKDLVIQTLGMDAAATEAQVVGKLTQLVNQQNTINELQKKLSDMEQAQQNGKIKALVDSAVKAGKITSTQSPQFEKLAAADFEGTEAVLNDMPAYVQPNKVIEGKEQGKETVSLSDADEYDKLDKEGKLGILAKSDPVKFQKLYDAKIVMLKSSGVLSTKK